jgi:hypothetical protein
LRTTQREQRPLDLGDGVVRVVDDVVDAHGEEFDVAESACG